MLELGSKEQHLLGGIGFNILIVGLLVFAYTQAVRQLNLGKDLSQRLREQLTVAREQLARQSGRTDLAQIQAQVAELKKSMAPPSAAVLPAWGPRENPFRSPLSHPGALRLSPEKQASLYLSGIIQQDDAATCVINGQVLNLGDWVGGYQVILVTRDAVLLEGKGEELLLRLP